ncbi:MAG: 1-acyl-sn-glycerol-3-phosphate acyltransferase, partial [Bacteroidota bacterium]
MMKTILEYILTPFFHLYMIFLIVVFYPIQVVALHLFGENRRQKSVDLLNYAMVKGLYLLGARVEFTGFDK